MDTWVQCYKCRKWRRVDGPINEDAPWECRYNTFCPRYNRCEHPQEEMPEEGEKSEEKEGDVIEDLIVDEDEFETVADEDTEMFTPSACQCAVCLEANEAVTHWPEGDIAHHIPLIGIIKKAIDKTEPLARRGEDDKQFAKGVCIDLSNPVREVQGKKG